MKDFITIAVFTLPSEMVVAKARLESEEIECRVLDELTVQSYNFISNAIGGIKLQVLSNDIAHAKAILKDGGFIGTEKPEASYIEKQLENPRTLRKVKRWFIVFFGLLFLIVVILVANSLIN